MNIAAVRGQVLRPPNDRIVPSTGARMVSIDVGVTYDDGAAETVEVTWVDPPASKPLPRQGNEVVAIGRMRRRFFRTGAGATVGRMELVADTVLSPRQKSQITRRLELLL